MHLEIAKGLENIQVARSYLTQQLLVRATIVNISLVSVILELVCGWHMRWLYMCVVRKRLYNKKYLEKHAMRILNVADA